MDISFESILNARELGGIPTEDGRRVKPNLLFRTAGLGKATDADVAKLAGYGVKAIFDLRDEYEYARIADRPVPGARHIHLIPLPMEEAGGPTAEIRRDTFLADPAAFFPGIYRYMALHSAPAYEKFFAELLSLQGAPVLWHCTQGKDRTGLAALLLLTVLNVSRERIVADYLYSNVAFEAEYAEKSPSLTPFERDAYRYIFFVREENLLLYLRLVEEQFGSLDQYIRQALHVSDADRARLQAWYLD